MLLPTRRTVLKWLHWIGFFLILYFFLVEPDESRADPGGALSTHAGMGLLLAVTTLLWSFFYWRKGLASRPGPKLPGWARRLHPWLHRALYWGVPVMVLSGALTGLAAPFSIRAFYRVPVNFSFGAKGLHEALQEVHEFIFDALVILIVIHAAFHLWRHHALRDNALRIMVPRALHRYL